MADSKRFRDGLLRRVRILARAAECVQRRIRGLKSMQKSVARKDPRMAAGLAALTRGAALLSDRAAEAELIFLGFKRLPGLPLFEGQDRPGGTKSVPAGREQAGSESAKRESPESESAERAAALWTVANVERELESQLLVADGITAELGRVCAPFASPIPGTASDSAGCGPKLLCTRLLMSEVRSAVSRARAFRAAAGCPVKGLSRKADANDARAWVQDELALELEGVGRRLRSRSLKLSRSSAVLRLLSACLAGRAESLGILAELLDDKASSVDPGSSPQERMVARSLASRAARFIKSAALQTGKAEADLEESERRKQEAGRIDKEASLFLTEAMDRRTSAQMLRSDSDHLRFLADVARYNLGTGAPAFPAADWFGESSWPRTKAEMAGARAGCRSRAVGPGTRRRGLPGRNAGASAGEGPAGPEGGGSPP
jgi:hypothetical protein